MESQDKSILAAETLQAFFDQFGDDVYAEEFLMILLEELLRRPNDGKTLRIFGKQK